MGYLAIFLTAVLVALAVHHGQAATTPTMTKECGTTKVDMIFLVDSSGSLGQANFEKELDFVKTIVNDSVIGPANMQVSLVTFSAGVHKQFNLNEYKDKASILNAIDQVLYDDDTTNTAAGLDFVRTTSIKAQSGARADAKQVLIVITDGNSDSASETKTAAMKLHQTRLEVFAIGIGTGIQQDELKTIASVDSNVFQVQDFNALKTIEGIVQKKACATVAPIKKECGTTKVDMIFLVDSSGSLGQANFEKELDFVKTIVNDSVIGPANMQVSLVTFSAGVHKQFNLNEYKDKASILNAIDQVLYDDDTTNTAAGLDFVRTTSIKAQSGARADAKQVLIVITDGNSDSASKTKTAAMKLHQTGLEVFAIGIGTGIQQDELKTIASVDSNVFQVQDFNALKTIEGIVQKKACATVAPIKKDCGTTKVDMIFLVDSSGSLGQANFEKELDFVKTIVNDSVIGPANMQVSLVTFSAGVHKQFNLNEYKDKASILNAIDQVLYDGATTNTAAGLDFVRTTSITSQSGARADAKQVLIVITDGNSDSASKTKTAAMKLHQTGLEVFAIGIGIGIKQDELKTIASVDSNVFQVQDFNALKTIEGIVQKKACATVAPRCGAQPTDIIFLLDSSGSVHKGHFKEALNFVSDFVSDSIVGAHNLQVGVVTFSTNVKNQIALNRFSDKNALIAAIKNVRYDQGLTLTSKGLKFVRTIGFSKANGGRANASEILVILTDGNSNHATKTINEAQLIHLTHIKIFAIGVGRHISRTELETISTDKNKNVFMVKDYDALKTIENELKKTICATTPPPPVCGVTPADLVFLLDASGSINDADFQKELSFVSKFVSKSEIGNMTAQVGVVTFTDFVQNEFFMDKYHDKAAMIQAILNIKRTAGGTMTSEGLKFVREQSLKHGTRAGVHRVVVVITDGMSNDKLETVSEAKLLHKMSNVTVISIGVGDSVDRNELITIATDENHVFMVNGFDTLTKIFAELFRAACSKPQLF